MTFQTISQLFYDSLAISAWKSTGEHSWALRVNPSSGNLHPTEGYLICGPIDGLGDRPMVCHYAPKEHGLEVRAEFEREMWDALWLAAPADIFLVGLTSIHWREAWKYGQRAYRYCQHAQPISPRLGCRDHGRRRPKAAKSAAVRATRESAAFVF